MTFSTNLISKILFGIFLTLTHLSCDACDAAHKQATDLTTEFSFTEWTEGSPVGYQGNRFVVDFIAQGTAEIVYDYSLAAFFMGLPLESIGNGIRFDPSGNKYIAEYLGHPIFQIKKGFKKRAVRAHNPALAPNGDIYLSGPTWVENTGSIWMVTAARNIILLEQDMGTTNTIAVRRDGKTLYVNESNRRNAWQYHTETEGCLFRKTDCKAFHDYGMHGMRCGNKVNLYLTPYGKGTVVAVSPDKKIIKEVQLKGEKPSNLTFGDKNGRTCFVTMANLGCLESFPAVHPRILEGGMI